MVFQFYKNYFNMLVDWWFSKFKVVYFPYAALPFIKSIDKTVLRKIPFCY